MTGFGRGSVDAGERRLRVEIRSVNHRGLDLKIRSGESDAFCDTEIARAVRAAVERGAVTVLIRDESAAAAAGLDEARVRALYGVLERLRQELKIQEPVTLATVGAYLGASHGSALSGEALWELLRPAVAVALIGDALGHKVSAIYEDERAGDIKHSWADIGAAQSRLGYTAGVSFAEGLGRTIDWYKSQG